MKTSYYVPLDAGAATWSPAEVSASTVAVPAVGTGHHLLKLENYSRLKMTHGKNGRYIESGAFKVGGHTWTVRCYLNGNTREDAGFVAFFLHLCGGDAAGPVVHAEYVFALVRHLGTPSLPAPANGRQGKPRPSTTSSHGIRFGIFGGKNKSFSWGLARFISVEELERSVFLRDDCLAVRCTVTVVEERTVKEKAVQPHDMARLGMICKCDDDLCKRHHNRPHETFLERFAKFCYSICHGSAPLK